MCIYFVCLQFAVCVRFTFIIYQYILLFDSFVKMLMKNQYIENVADRTSKHTIDRWYDTRYYATIA